jgi:hypothetical protein
MKKILLCSGLVLAAIVIRFVPMNFDIAWRIDKNTLRGTPLNHVIPWALLALVAIYILFELVQGARKVFLQS